MTSERILTINFFMPEPALVRMQDVAERAGVGRTTVSLALRNHPKISEPTRQRIRKLRRKWAIDLIRWSRRTWRTSARCTPSH